MSDLNDPRVLFAAERTLLAWSRTSLALMAFGFVIERFGLFLRILIPSYPAFPKHEVSVWIGLVFIIFSGMFSMLSTLQHRRMIRTLKPVEIPEGYWVNLPMILNWALVLLSLALCGYLLYSVFGVSPVSG